MTSLANHNGQFDIVYVDPPWPMYGDPNKNAAAGKHYSLMDMNEIESMDLVSLLRDRRHGAFFVWATCPRLDLAMDAIRSWGLHYRGVAFVWVKQGRMVQLLVRKVYHQQRQSQPQNCAYLQRRRSVAGRSNFKAQGSARLF